MRIYPRDSWPFKIVEEKAVTASIASARERWPRFDDIWDGIVWLIGHGGHKIAVERRAFGKGGYYIYTYEGDAQAGFPRIVVAYRYGLERFTLRMIVVSDPPQQ